MVQFCWILAGMTHSLLGEKQAREAVARAAAERLNLIGAQEAALERGMRAEAVAFAYWLNELFERSGHWDLRRRALENGLKAATPGTRDEAAFRHNLGVLAQDTGDYGQARQFYQESLRIAEELGDRAGVAKTLHQLGMLAQDTGDYGQARQFYERAAETFRDLGARREQAAVLHQLGMLAQATGDYGQARRLYEESLRIEEELGDRAGVAISLGQLGRLAELEGNYRVAVRLWAVALATFEELHSPNRDIVLGWFARLREQLGEERFEQLLREALGGGD